MECCSMNLKKSLSKNFKLNEHSNEYYDNDEHEPIENNFVWISHPTDFETIQTSLFYLDSLFFSQFESVYSNAPYVVHPLHKLKMFQYLCCNLQSHRDYFNPILLWIRLAIYILFIVRLLLFVRDGVWSCVTLNFWFWNFCLDLLSCDPKTSGGGSGAYPEIFRGRDLNFFLDGKIERRGWGIGTFFLKTLENWIFLPKQGLTPKKPLNTSLGGVDFLI